MAFVQHAQTLGEILRHEYASIQHTRTKVLLKGLGSSKDFKIGMLISKEITNTVTPDGGNTGDGVLTVAGILHDVQIGAYVCTCIAIAANGGTFKVIAPNGERLDDAVVGTATSQHLTFTIADGATDFALGDKITITTVESGKWLQYDESGLIGDKIAAGVLISDITVPASTDTYEAAIVRGPVVFTDEGIDFNSANAAQKALTLIRLEKLDIHVKKEV